MICEPALAEPAVDTSAERSGSTVQPRCSVSSVATALIRPSNSGPLSAVPSPVKPAECVNGHSASFAGSIVTWTVNELTPPAGTVTEAGACTVTPAFCVGRRPGRSA